MSKENKTKEEVLEDYYAGTNPNTTNAILSAMEWYAKTKSREAAIAFFVWAESSGYSFVYVNDVREWKKRRSPGRMVRPALNDEEIFTLFIQQTENK